MKGEVDRGAGRSRHMMVERSRLRIQRQVGLETHAGELDDARGARQGGHRRAGGRPNRCSVDAVVQANVCHNTRRRFDEYLTDGQLVQSASMPPLYALDANGAIPCVEQQRTPIFARRCWRLIFSDQRCAWTVQSVLSTGEDQHSLDPVLRASKVRMRARC